MSFNYNQRTKIWSFMYLLVTGTEFFHDHTIKLLAFN